MSAQGSADDFEAYRADIEAAERRVAGEIDPGARGLVVAILVFVLVLSFILPHTGSVKGVDVLMGNDAAISVGIALPSRIFTWLSLVFGVGFSMLALITRRWTLAWIALAGTAVACAIGMLAVWSRQTASQGHPGPGVGTHCRLDHGDSVDLPLGPAGVDANRCADGRRGSAPSRGCRYPVDGASGGPRPLRRP